MVDGQIIFSKREREAATHRRETKTEKRKMKKATEKLQLAGKKSDTLDEEQKVSLPGWTKRMMRICQDYNSWLR